MKTQYKVAGMMIGFVLSSTAFAIGPTEDKPATRIDFNEIISQNKDKGDTLAKSMRDQMAKDNSISNSDVQEQQEQKEISKFVDVEMGLQSDKPVIVDRRFNSIDEPVISDGFDVVVLSTDSGAPN